jgi:cold shock CspA family protein
MSTDSTTQRMTRMVKWFNNKSGFGFITVCGEGESGGKDIFVHYSSIRVTNSQYKYLVQGEYVDFQLMKSENGKHEYHATDITGVSDGPILCETRRVALASQSERNGSKGGNNRRNDRPDSPTEAPSDEAPSAEAA